MSLRDRTLWTCFELQQLDQTNIVLVEFVYLTLCHVKWQPRWPNRVQRNLSNFLSLFIFNPLFHMHLAALETTVHGHRCRVSRILRAIFFVSMGKKWARQAVSLQRCMGILWDFKWWRFCSGWLGHLCISFPCRPNPARGCTGGWEHAGKDAEGAPGLMDL